MYNLGNDFYFTYYSLVYYLQFITHIHLFMLLYLLFGIVIVMEVLLLIIPLKQKL